MLRAARVHTQLSAVGGRVRCAAEHEGDLAEQHRPVRHADAGSLVCVIL